MTNTGGTPAGWYYAPGDPEGTQRYWDGAQWIGEPQPVPQQPAPAATPDPAPAAPDYDQTVQYQPPAQQATPPAGEYQTPGADPAASAPPNYGASEAQPPGYQQPPAGAQPPGYQQPAPAYGAAPPGYQNYGTPAANVGTPAEWGTRAIAYLIDIAPVFVLYVLVLITSLISDVLGLLVSIVGYLAVLAYVIWNFYIKQGSTGQTIGKEKQGIKLVSDATGQPVGAGMAFVRYLVVGAFILACCIGWVVNLLSPLWNEDKKTYSDKIMKMSVVTA